MWPLLVACEPDPTVPTDTTDTTTDTTAPVALHDPLSMPEEPTLDPADFRSAEYCAKCHPDHAAEWAGSMHAYSMVDPVFQGLVMVRQADLDGLQDQFCTQCHSAIATRGGEIGAGFAFAELSPIAMEGITCTSCHQITEVARDYNSGHVIDAAAPVQGPIADPTVAGAHASAYNEVFDDSLFCAGCHDVIEADGLDLERPYREWTESPAAEAGQTCQGCHMPEVERPAAKDGPVRTTHEHRWVGVDVPLADGFATPDEVDAMRERTRTLLDGAASLALEAPSGRAPGVPLDVTVSVTNLIAGHNLPTGSTFLRQVWVDLVATDADGDVLYETGQLDANGDLMDYWSALAPFGDPDLISLSSGMVDADGARTLFPWTADELATGAIPAGYTRTWTLFVPTEGATGPIAIEAHLRFRPLPPYLLRLLGLGDRVGELEIYDVASDTAEVSLAE